MIVSLYFIGLFFFSTVTITMVITVSRLHDGRQALAYSQPAFFEEENDRITVFRRLDTHIQHRKRCPGLSEQTKTSDSWEVHGRIRNFLDHSFDTWIRIGIKKKKVDQFKTLCCCLSCLTVVSME